MWVQSNRTGFLPIRKGRDTKDMCTKSTEWEDSLLQVKERDFSRNPNCQPVDLELPAFRTVKK